MIALGAGSGLFASNGGLMHQLPQQRRSNALSVPLLPDPQAPEARRRAYPGARVEAGKAAPHGRLGRVAPVANMLAGLGRCPLCGSMMQLQRGEAVLSDWRYLVCSRGYVGGACERRYIRYPGIEAALTTGVEAIIGGCPMQRLDPTARKLRLGEVRSQLAELRSRRTRLEADAPALLALKAPVRSVIADVDAKMAALAAERRRLRPGSTGWIDVTLRARLDQLGVVARADPPHPPSINAVLKYLMTQVVVDWPRGVLVLKWRHGGRSEIAVAMTRRRALSDKHRSHDPGMPAAS